MNKDPLISIIVPIYNVEKYLCECIDSILNQTYSNIEVILVDDGSPDSCPKICDSYKEKDKRVKVIHKKNGGVSSSREVGVLESSGKYIMFVDSDDWIDPQTLKICVDKINEIPGLDCVMFSYAKEFINNSIAMEIMGDSIFLEGKDTENKFYRRLFGLIGEELAHPEQMENITPCCMKLYKSELVKKGKYFDIKNIGSCEDGLFNMYALHDCNKVFYINEPLYHYRKDVSSATSSHRPNLIQQWGNLFSIMENIIDEKHLGSEYRDALSNRIALSITAVGLNELWNPNNGTIDHIKVIKAYLKQEKYHKAVSQLKIKHMPLPWKMLMISCKMKFATAVYFAIMAIEKLRKQ